MEFATLGKTGLRVSVMGLGAGGPSRLGRATHKDEAVSVRVVRKALDLGVNYFDTAESYGTEETLAEGLHAAKRDDLVIATKKSCWRPHEPPLPEAKIVEGLEASLRRLKTSWIDVYQMHAVLPDVYAQVRDHVMPVLHQLRAQGKVRFFGITEMFNTDPAHAMLEKAVLDDCWDTMMVGYNILNPSAAHRIFPTTRKKGIGTQVMFAVRRALSQPERLSEVIAQLRERGAVGDDVPASPEALDFLLHDGGAERLPEAAYRFCRHTPGVDVVLSGTGNVEHLSANADALQRSPLPKADLERLRAMFGRVDCVSGS